MLDVRRRDFIALLGGAAVWPLAARAQQRMHRIGVLVVDGQEQMGPYAEALRELGYVEGRNIRVEMRTAQGHAHRLSGLAVEMVRSKIDVIVASLTPAVMAARRATSEIPIVMAPAGDPVEIGLVSSLARKHSNCSGSCCRWVVGWGFSAMLTIRSPDLS
jgi:putative ABC transport system substrate-binding protein